MSERTQEMVFTGSQVQDAQVGLPAVPVEEHPNDPHYIPGFVRSYLPPGIERVVFINRDALQANGSLALQDQLPSIIVTEHGSEQGLCYHYVDVIGRLGQETLNPQKNGATAYIRTTAGMYVYVRKGKTPTPVELKIEEKKQTLKVLSEDELWNQFLETRNLLKSYGFEVETMKRFVEKGHLGCE